jgi:hypothetical protein
MTQWRVVLLNQLLKSTTMMMTEDKVGNTAKLVRKMNENKTLFKQSKGQTQVMNELF